MYKAKLTVEFENEGIGYTEITAETKEKAYNLAYLRFVSASKSHKASNRMDKMYRIFNKKLTPIKSKIKSHSIEVIEI